MQQVTRILTTCFHFLSQSKEFDHDMLPVTGSQGTRRRRRSASTGAEARKRRKPDSLDTRWEQSRLNCIQDQNLILLNAAKQAINILLHF